MVGQGWFDSITKIGVFLRLCILSYCSNTCVLLFEGKQYRIDIIFREFGVCMFFTNTSKKLTKVTTAIIQNTELSDLVNGTYEKTEITICPTQAISIDNNSIDGSLCVKCGICRKLIPDIIEYIPEKDDTAEFVNYCSSHKMFVYKWLCLANNDLSGIEIFIRGFSRNKRVPFISMTGGLVKITKSADTVGELAKVQADLQDIVKLTQNIIDLSLTEISIVLIKEPSNNR